MDGSRPQLRRGIGAATAAVLLAATTAACTHRSTTRFDTGRLGQVHLYESKGDPSGLVFLLSSARGWADEDERAADALAARGAIVVGVDFRGYRDALDRSDGECLYLLSEIESLSQQVQRSFKVESYFSPILIGVGESGALAAAALAQAPAATLAGAVSIDPGATVATRLPLCAGAPAAPTKDGFAYRAVSQVPGFWSIGLTERAKSAVRTHARALLDAGMPGSIEDAGHGETDLDLLVRLVSPHLGAGTADAVAAKLPLVELPAREPNGLVMIVLSGDGGWRDLDKTVAEQLREQGVSVVGWDSLRYFWRQRSPDELARDLEAVIRTYAKQWNARAIGLTGYSFGADVLPFAYNRFQADTRALVKQISLLGFGHSADFVFHVTAWLGAGPGAQALPTLPELKTIPGNLIQCFYGRDEDDTACPDLKGAGAEVIATAGGHHFDGDYAALAARILAGLHRRAPIS